ncbi:MAG: CNNM domain-containing protein [Brevinematia bacterium]
MIEYILIAVITSILSALTSGFEAMFIALNIYDLSKLNITSRKYKKIEFLILNKRIFLFVFLFLNTIWNVLFSISIFYTFLKLNLPEVVSGVLSVIVVTPFLFVFSEVLPKALFRSYKEKIILLTYPIFLPIAFIGSIVFRKNSEDTISFEHIATVIQEEFEESEFPTISEILKNIASLEEINLKNIMLPIKEINTVSPNTSLKEAIDTTSEKDFIIILNRTDPVGFVNLRHISSKFPKTDPLGNITNFARKPKYIAYEGLEVSKLFESEIDFKEPIFVVNDTGTLVGIVSYEQILITLIKAISETRRRETTTKSLIVDGNESIFTVLEILGKNPSKAESEYPWIRVNNTVSGIIMTINGFLPKIGQKIKFSDITLQVLEISGFRISKVRVSA